MQLLRQRTLLEEVKRLQQPANTVEKPYSARRVTAYMLGGCLQKFAQSGMR